MKPVFKCDYCDFMGTKDEVENHEVGCFDNYDRKSCFTCTHKSIKSATQYQCDCGIEIPEGKIFEFCGQYERKEKADNPLCNLFGDIFSRR